MQLGETAPDFELPDQNGIPVRLGKLLETGPVVLFFYPAAMTSGCTAESCHFRDLSAEFEKMGAHRVGISPDPVERQRQFAELNGFDYPLLSDPDGAVATRFGARRSGILASVAATRRQTFVIDTDATVLEIIQSEVRMQRHAEEALRVLRARKS